MNTDVIEFIGLLIAIFLVLIGIVMMAYAVIATMLKIDPLLGVFVIGLMLALFGYGVGEAIDV